MKNILLLSVLLALLFASCSNDPVLFKKIGASASGISFNNLIVENDSVNPIDLEFLYNGAGVAVGDFNNDGLPDLYFTASTVSNRLYINKGNLKFEDVTRQSGVSGEGMWCSSASVVDINNDGKEDIYVANDFFGSDNLYINNKNGTFKDEIRSYLKHTSENAMGVDIDDINNDGLADILSVDMNPEDNYRKKKNLNGNNYYLYQNMTYENVMLQYVRNTLQLNMGPAVKSNDSNSTPVFADVSFLSGVAETDWSWNHTIADFNNDGNRDIIITNGYPRDVTDHDFTSFRTVASKIVAKKDIIDQMPVIRISNYAFMNNGNLKFDDVTEKWGLREPSFANGAVAVDLDNDGDLDYIINNINEEASLYENTLNTKEKVKKNFLNIAFNGDKSNTKGIGAFAQIYYDGARQVYENQPCRGYLSCVDTKAHFGLDTVSLIDSVIIRWPGNKKQILKNVRANQLLTVDINNANMRDIWNIPAIDSTAMFTDITGTAAIQYKHQETDYIDFDKERLLPHKFSQYGPGLAAADVDGNGLDDIYIGGCVEQAGSFLLQQGDGTFIPRSLPDTEVDKGKRGENMGVLLFDADNDGDNDLWCANGSNEFAANTNAYSDKFYINDGKGNFRLDTTVMPANYTSKSCVRAADFDNDGDLDLFIGGRCLPGKYPTPVSSFIYRNDSKNGVIKFTDITSATCKGLLNIGMVCDAVWTDFNNDGTMDLIIAGEWMPLTFFKNTNGKFENVTAATGIGNQTGWWSSIISGDFDNDGDIDYVAGNLGENAFFRTSPQYPIKMYAKDFDNNGNIDAITTMFLKDQRGTKREYPAMSRDDIVSQVPSLKKKFLTYKAFALATVQQIFTDEQLKDALVLQANNFSSCYIQNNGNGKFEIKALPAMAQLAPLNGMVADDFNNDGNLDIAV